MSVPVHEDQQVGVKFIDVHFAVHVFIGLFKQIIGHVHVDIELPKVGQQGHFSKEIGTDMGGHDFQLQKIHGGGNCPIECQRGRNHERGANGHQLHRSTVEQVEGGIEQLVRVQKGVQHGLEVKGLHSLRNDGQEEPEAATVVVGRVVVVVDVVHGERWWWRRDVVVRRGRGVVVVVVAVVAVVAADPAEVSRPKQLLKLEA